MAMIVRSALKIWRVLLKHRGKLFVVRLSEVDVIKKCIYCCISDFACIDALRPIRYVVEIDHPENFRIMRSIKIINKRVTKPISLDGIFRHSSKGKRRIETFSIGPQCCNLVIDSPLIEKGFDIGRPTIRVSWC